MDLFDLAMQEDKKKENILEKYKVNDKISKIVIPTFEIFYKDDTGFGIYVCEDENENKFQIVGTFISSLVIDQTYLVEGSIKMYKGEKQLRVSKIQQVKPVNKRGIIKYLQTLKGLKSKAELIYEEFGDKSIDMLMNEPLIVASKIKGIGEKSVLSWKAQLDKMKDSQYVITKLLDFGLSMKEASKLHQKYKEEIVAKIEENPYFLASEVKGYGFEKCDRIARSMNFDPKSKFRLQEGLIYVLEEASNEGHCFLPLEELMKKAINKLSIKLTVQEMQKLVNANRPGDIIEYEMGEMKFTIPYDELKKQWMACRREKNQQKKEAYRYVLVPIDEEEVGEQLKEITAQRRVIYDNGKIYLRQFYLDEIKVAQRVKSLSIEKEFRKPLQLEKVLDRHLKTHQIELEEKQREAVLEFAKYRGGFYILNGSAGCGKTFTLKIILSILEMQYEHNGLPFEVKVFAPTGKASKVASKSTGLPCVTVHRGLGYNPKEGFAYHEDEPLECDVLVVDETSMLDINLTKHLLNAVADGTKVIFIGDTKQLPSVGAGNVLQDLIDSGFVKVVTLNVIKRQGKQSGIIRNANKIIKGEMIDSCEDTKDAYVIFRQTPQAIQKTILQSIDRILTFDGYTFEDIQVLCPQRNGLLGTYMLNYLIQQKFNPNDDGIKVLNQKFQITLDPSKGVETIELYFKKGDKVIHIKNNYDKVWFIKDNIDGYKEDESIVGITNGECGIIEDILEYKDNQGEMVKRIIVRYDDRYVFYDDDFEELDHAYALTIHKSQGSQWKAVIMPIAKQNYLMLDNNLFYTGYTRAEQFHCTIGQREAIAYAIKTYKSRDRYTNLDKRIQRKEVA